jgi:hypothetical protein
VCVTVLSVNLSALLYTMLMQRTVKQATTINARMGSLLDGAIIHFEDDHKTPCGPRWRTDGKQHRYGGHLSDKFDIPPGVEITKVEVGRSRELDAVRFSLSNGSVGGYVCDDPKLSTIHTLGEYFVTFFSRDSSLIMRDFFMSLASNMRYLLLMVNNRARRERENYWLLWPQRMERYRVLWGRGIWHRHCAERCRAA